MQLLELLATVPIARCVTRARTVLPRDATRAMCSMRLVASYPEPSPVSSSKARLTSDSSIFITQSSSLSTLR